METVKRPLIEWSAALRSLHEESGDQYLVRQHSDGVLVGVADGLGHGPEAAVAARRAISVLDAHPEEPVDRLLRRCHQELRATRGVVMSVASFSASEATMTWAGVGSVDGLLLRSVTSRGMAGSSRRDVAEGRRPEHAEASAKGARVSIERLFLRGGVIGHQLPPLDFATLPVSQGDVLIFTTDGIRGEFAEGFQWGYLPPPTAERILADHAKSTDDALVVVARYAGAQ